MDYKKSKRELHNSDERPRFEITFDEDSDQGIRFISIVSDPAIEIKGMYFSKSQEKQFEFKHIKEQQKIVGPAMVPNQYIFRKDGDYEYDVFFSADTIQRMKNKFNKENKRQVINDEHTSRMVDAYVDENWMVKQKPDNSEHYGYDLPVGTWFVEVKVDDPEYWEQDVKGFGKFSFSIEGIMGMSPVNMANEYDDNIDERELTSENSILKDLLRERVGLDFDGVLSTDRGQKLARAEMRRGNTVFIVTKRSAMHQMAEVFALADILGIPRECIHSTNHSWKYKKLNELMIDRFYDDQQEEIDRIIKYTNIVAKKF